MSTPESIRPATMADLDDVVAIYDAIHMLEERGRMTVGWIRGVYPTRATAEEAILAGELYVFLGGESVVASGRINQHQEESYAEGSWTRPVPASEVLVLHTLTVSPAESGQGIGTAFVRFYERCARERGCTQLRLDTQEKNAAARRLYARLGFREVGIVHTDFHGIEDIRLVLLEKDAR